MDNFDYLFVKARESGKVAKALSKKLQTEIDKKDIISVIDSIDISSIISSQFKSMGIETETVTNNNSTIGGSEYSSNYNIEVLNAVNATSIGTSSMQYCIGLTKVNAANVIDLGQSCFSGCLSLTDVNVPSATTLANYAFYNCESIKRISLPSLTKIGTGAFKFCISLTSLILGGNQIATLSSTTAFDVTPIASGTGYVYVPDDLVDSYKTATNWSVYADQIRPMSEYEE